MNARSRVRRGGLALLAAAVALGAAGCGDDTVVFTYDCCSGNVYYVCTGSAAYGRCLSIPSDTSGCVVHGGACPADANR